MSEYKRLTIKDKYKIIRVNQSRGDLLEDYESLKNRLAELEDKIENGTLIELPCKVGDTIYLIPSKTQFELNRLSSSFSKHNRVYEMEVYQLYMNKNDYVLYNFEQTASALGSSFGENWFLTKAEAEKKLNELKNKDKGNE